MKGFDPEFRDLEDYILTITRRIWEERQVHTIHDYYAADCPVRAPGGLVVGAEAVIAATLATLAEFPDRQVLGADVVGWGDDDRGWLSSHRIVSKMTHLGDGAHGPATGRRVTAPVIADCWCVGNQIVEEWLVRDGAAVARHLGTTPRALAERQRAVAAARGLAPAWWTPARDVPGAFTPPVERDGAAGIYGAVLEALWGERAVRRIPEAYHRAATQHVAGDRLLTGRDEIERFVLSYLAALPDAAFAIDSLFAEERAGMPVRVAARWSLTGTHAGHGAFGPPTGAPVHVMGISQAHVVDGVIRAEWVATDEVAIWHQILDGAAVPTIGGAA